MEERLTSTLQVRFSHSAGKEKSLFWGVGIRYRKDYLKAGIASDYGRNSLISRVAKEDMILYQTERYDVQQFSYEIDLLADGDYVLWLKFSEVWFNGPNMKVFQIVLNDEHSLIDELDIFAKVGRATAHDEYIPFQIQNGRLVVKSRSSSYSGLLKVTFQRLDHRDNPKVNALILWKGSIERSFFSSLSSSSPRTFFLLEIPKLPPIPELDQPDEPMEMEGEEEEEENDEPAARATKVKRNLKTSGPKVVDPYADGQSSFLMPLLIGLAAVIPVIFCLYRL